MTGASCITDYPLLESAVLVAVVSFVATVELEAVVSFVLAEAAAAATRDMTQRKCIFMGFKFLIYVVREDKRFGKN